MPYSRVKSVQRVTNVANICFQEYIEIRGSEELLVF